MKNYYHALVYSTQKYIFKSGLSGAIVGVSGGIDSALVLKIAVDALGNDNVIAVLMPSKYTSNDSTNIAIELSNNLGVKFHILCIDNMLNTLQSFSELQVEPESIAEQNMQARIRGLLLMSISNKINKIVLATSNRSEILTGYSTLYGDTCGGYAPLKYVYKTEVYQIANWCNKQIILEENVNQKNIKGYIPEFIINRAPTAELKFNQLDVQSLPPYDILDDILRKMFDMELDLDEISKSYDIKIVLKIKDLISKSEYKRLQFPEGINFKGYKDC